MAEKSVTIVLEAHNRLSEPFAEASRSVQGLASELGGSRPLLRDTAFDVRGLSRTVGMLGIDFGHTGSTSAEVATIVRRSGEQAALGWAAGLGPLGLLVAAVGGAKLGIDALAASWERHNREALAAAAAFRTVLTEHKALQDDLNAGIARARGDAAAAVKLERDRRDRELYHAAAERWQRALEARDVLLGKEAVFGPGEEADAAYWQQMTETAEAAHREDAKRIRERRATEDAADMEKAAAEGVKAAAQQAQAVAAEEARQMASGGRYMQAAAGGPDIGGVEAAMFAARRADLNQRLSVPIDQLPGISLDVFERMVKGIKAIEANTKPTGSGSWKPPPVY